MLLKLNRAEFYPLGNRLLTFMDYHFGYPDLQKFFESEEKVLKKMIESCQKIILVSAPTPDEYAEQIVNIVGGSGK